MKQKCPKCYQEYDFETSQEGKIFACIECGEDFIITGDNNLNSDIVISNKKQNKVPLIITVIFVFLLAIFFLVILGVNKTKNPPDIVAIAEKNKQEILENIKSGNIDQATKLLQQGNLKQDGWEFLFAAVNSGNIDMVRTVLSCGVSVNSVNPNDENALFIAVKNKNFPIFMFLVKKGANLNIDRSFGDHTIWSIAAENGATEIIEYLTMSQKNITECISGDKLIFRALRNGHTGCVKALLEKYSVDEMDGEGNTLLHIALQKQNTEIIKILLKRGADVNMTNTAGENAFFIAIKTNNNNLIKLFDLNKINWNDTTGNGTSIPMACVQAENNELLKLMTNSQNVNLVDSKGKTALYYACQKNNMTAVNLLLSMNAHCNATVLMNTPLYIAVKNNNADLVRLLKNSGAKFNPAAVDNEGNNLLMLTAAAGNVEIWKLLPLGEFDLFKTNKNGQNAYAIALAKQNAIAPLLCDMMDNTLYASVVENVNKITTGNDWRSQMHSIEQLQKQMENYKKISAYLKKTKAEIHRKLRNKATENIYNAINLAQKDKYYQSAIRTLERAIANNPDANNLSRAKSYLATLKKNLARDQAKRAALERRKNAVRQMSSNDLKNEVTSFVNKWLNDMRLDRNTSYYWEYPALASTLFNVKSWNVIGPADGEWSHFFETIIVSISSTNKGGMPIHKNWKVTLKRNDNMDWKVFNLSD